MQDRIKKTVTPGSFTVTDLFGIRNAQPPTENRPTTDRRRTLKRVRDREQRTVFTDFTACDGPTMAFLPYIDLKAFNITMDNYRLYIAAYNEKVKQQNIEIGKHNAGVRKYRAANPLTQVQAGFSATFMSKYGKLRPAHFNRMADDFNTQYGPLIEKRCILTVKYATEIIFQQMLHLYSVQMGRQTSEWLRLGIPEPRPVRKFDVNAHHVSTLKRNGARSVAVCNATIRNHRERLEECGVLTHYAFRGHKIGVKMHINSEILAVFDAKTGQYVTPENQRFTPESLKVLADNNEATGTFKRSIKKRENAGGDFPVNGTPAAGQLIVFYGNIPQQGADSEDTPGAENVKISQTLSEKLHDTLTHPHGLAEELAGGLHFAYNPIPIRYLYQEAKSGTLTRDEFKEVIIQDFFKTASRLWRGKPVFVGAWKNAINSWMEKRFTARNGGGEFTLRKDHMVELLQEYRWRIANAEKWFRKTGINPLYPSAYFDFTRQDKKEIGFEYTRRAWQRHLDYEKSKPQKTKKLRRKADVRAAGINHSRKYDTQLSRFFKGRIDLEQLYDYVQRNLPATYYEKLTHTILTMSVAKARYETGDFADA